MLAPLLRFELRHQLLPDHRITHRVLLTFFAQAARRAKSPSLIIPINSPCPSTTGRALIRFLNKMLATCRTEASGLNRNHIHDHDVPGFHTPRPCSSISTKSQRNSPPAHAPFSFSIKLDGTAPKTSRLPKTSRSCRCRRVRRSSTRKKISGNSCGRTGCRTASSNPSTKSSITAATPGIRSSINPGKSCPSLAAIGQSPVTHCEGWYKRESCLDRTCFPWFDLDQC